MNKKVKKVGSLLITIVGTIAIAIGLSYAHATGTWNEAPLHPPEGNTPNLVNVGSLAQIKGTSDSAGGLSVNEFSAAKNAQFDAITAFRGFLIGLTGTDPEESILSFGDNTSTVDLSADGALYVSNDGLYSNKIKAPSGTLKPVCSDKQGNIILCSPAIKPAPTNATVMVYYTVAWDKAYKYSRLLYKDWWHAPLRLVMVSQTPLPTFTFKWGYCHTYNNTKNNNRENSGGWFPLNSDSGDHVIPGQCIGFPTGFSNLPYTVDSYTDPNHVENYYGAGSGYVGTGSVTNGSTVWTGLLASTPNNSGHRSTWDEKFDKRGYDTNKFGQVTKIIIYDVKAPPGFTLTFGPSWNGVPVEVR